VSSRSLSTSLSSRRSTQRSTSTIVRSSRAAANRSGARSFWPRVFQYLCSAVPRVPRSAVWAMVAASCWAPAQVRQKASGVQRARPTRSCRGGRGRRPPRDDHPGGLEAPRRAKEEDRVAVLGGQQPPECPRCGRGSPAPSQVHGSAGAGAPGEWPRRPTRRWALGPGAGRAGVAQAGAATAAWAEVGQANAGSSRWWRSCTSTGRPRRVRAPTRYAPKARPASWPDAQTSPLAAAPTPSPAASS
jgi:hypothetical protein